MDSKHHLVDAESRAAEIAELDQLRMIVRERTHRVNGCICERCCEDEYATARVVAEMRAELARLRAELARLRAENDEVRDLCRRHATPGSNPGAHQLAVDVLRILGDRPHPREPEWPNTCRGCDA